jgi:peptidoglycan hydrolase CwlO-like protein
MGKILVIASVVISLATAGLGFVNKNKLGETKQGLETAQADLTAAKTQKEAAEKSLKAKTDELATAVAEKEQAVAQATQAQSELTSTKTALAEATQKASTAETQLTQANTELAELKNKVAELSNAGSGTTQADNSQVTELTNRIQEQELLIAKLQSELDNSKTEIKQFVIEKKQREDKVLAKGTEGRVLAVNPAWNFVVLNLGDKQNVSNNTELLVKRGTRYLGKVRITSVEPSTSIADIVANSMPQGVTITPGDTVIFQGDEE